MAQFDPFTRLTLDVIFNTHFTDEIKTDINEILPLIISGDLTIPKSNSSNNNLLDALSIGECKFHKNLTEDKIVNGVRTKCGFNRLEIISKFLGEDVKQFLNDIDNQYTLSSIQLSKLNEICGGNIVFGKYLSQIMNGFGNLLVDPLVDDDLKRKMFKYMFNRIEDYEDAGHISFLYMYGFFMLHMFYLKLTDFQTAVFLHIIDNNRLQHSQISYEFNKYYNDNSVSIINDVGDYCYRNIFHFNQTYTALFDNTVDVGISSSMFNLFQLFGDNVSDIIDEQFTSSILLNITDQLCLHTANHWLTNTNDAVSGDVPHGIR